MKRMFYDIKKIGETLKIPLDFDSKLYVDGYCKLIDKKDNKYSLSYMLTVPEKWGGPFKIHPKSEFRVCDINVVKSRSENFIDFIIDDIYEYILTNTQLNQYDDVLTGKLKHLISQETLLRVI